MLRTITKAWQEDDGILSFEWTMLITLVVIGIVTGVTAMRDGVVDELGDVSQAMLAVDGSYRISNPLSYTIDVDGAGPEAPVLIDSGRNSEFIDAMQFTDCERAGLGGPDQFFFPISLDDDGNGP